MKTKRQVTIHKEQREHAEELISGYRHGERLDADTAELATALLAELIGYKDTVLMVSGDVALDDPEIAGALEDIHQAGARRLRTL